ncbi:MAG: hypothetical protein NUV67_03680 [archaeon]|nr:hypothetical protein [archaeon]
MNGDRTYKERITACEVEIKNVKERLKTVEDKADRQLLLVVLSGLAVQLLINIDKIASAFSAIGIHI